MKKSITKVFFGALATAFLFSGMVSCSSGGSSSDDDYTPVVNPDNPSNPETPNDPDNPVSPSGSPATGVQDTPTVADVSNASVKIVKSEGWLNSAYIVFEQVEGATYKVLCDDKEIDAPLIRYYDDYTYYEQSEDANLQVSYTKKSLGKVVRADALGLAAGEHTMKVCAVGTENTSEYSTATMKVVDHDRSGFAFTGTKTPGAYEMDGTLKSGAVVIYLTQGNKSTVKATIGGKEYTGIQEITQQIKTKNTGTTPVDIRIIGTVKAESNDLSCADHKSSYALGVKEASLVTIEGVGHDATLYAAGVAAFKSEYIEISNLGLMKWGGGKDGDGVSLKEDSYAWVHNCDVFYGDAGSDGDQVKGDGSMDMKDDSNHVTVAYNHFWDSGKMSLCGMKSESGPNYITYHHNWFDHSDSRHPRIRTMTVHVYNNYFDGNAKYGVGVTTGASCFVEQNFFRNAHDPMMSSKQGTDAQGAGTFSGEKGGIIKAYNNKFEQNNTNGVKFQFITNKYDYTNNKELGEYKEWYETVGTDNGDGTWTIYDSVITNNSNTIVDNSLIAVEDATVKGAYYQASKGKTAFFIDVPSNTSKIVIKAKTGSSTSGATSGIQIKNESGTAIASVDNIGNTEYSDYEFTISGLTADSTLEIVNSSSKNSLNISEIKVIATSGWQTKLTSGADLTNIDAYEVDNRNDQVPAKVTAKSGGAQYSNFDVSMGDSGMGITIAPTEPDQAKADVLKYSGRHESDFAHNFDNATDDASYAKNDELNNALVAYKTGMTAIQGNASSSSSSSSSSDNTGNTGDNTSGNTGDNGGSGNQTALPEGTVVVTFNRDTYKTGDAINGVTVSGNLLAAKSTTAKEYNGTTYSVALKMESATSIKFTLASTSTVTVVTDTASKNLKVDGTKTKTGADGVLTTRLASGAHEITKGDSMNVYAIIITPAN